jgi:tetraacyldisaccharide 4'-kinase
MLFLYNLALALGSIILIPYYLARGKYRGTIGPRLGRLAPHLQQTGTGAIWLHAVSVGEVLSSPVLIRRLRGRLPGAKVLVSTTTPTGRKLAEEMLAPLVDGVFYAPLDIPFAVRRTLRCIRPRLVIVLETEIWPNWYREVKRWGASLLVVNGRISDDSAANYRRLRLLFGRVLGLADQILAQSPLDRERFLDAGAPEERLETAGNLKFDAPEPAEPNPLVARWMKALQPGAVILAGSTRENEEAPVLEAFRGLRRRFERLLLVVAPRHPHRCAEVAQLLDREGWSYVKRSELTESSGLSLPGVLLVDTLGELASLYRLADVVFVGGSLAGWGGHNVLEPALAAKPIVVGPHMQNFRAIADLLLAAGGLVQVGTAAELGPAWEHLLERPQEAAELGARAQRTVELHRGATQRAVDCAERLYHRAVPGGQARSPLLWLPSRCWEAAARLRNYAYQQGWIPAHRLDSFTVSIGGLTAGGAGKTPLVLWLLEQLRARGVRCVVLSRGYRRRSPEPVTILRASDEAPVEVTGDEVQLLRRRFRVAVGIAADRVAAGNELVERFHPDVVLLDDGFQHRRLERDLDIVVLDVTDPFGRRELLPSGRLREPISGLGRADAVVLNRVRAGERWEGLEEEIRRHNPQAPVLRARIEAVSLVHGATGAERPAAWLGGQEVTAFCGIGNPGAFYDTLAELGARLRETLAFPDHHRYRRIPQGALLITTEKDWVNLERLGPPPAELYWVKTRLVVEGGERLIDLILSPDREGALP